MNNIKYNFTEVQEEIQCPHCKDSFSYDVKYHFEDRPRKKNGHIISPLELLPTKIYDSAPPALCDLCTSIPRCVDCGILLCNIENHTFSRTSFLDKNVCELCMDVRLGVYPQYRVAIKS